MTATGEDSPSYIELELVVHLEDGRVVTAKGGTITVPPPSTLLRVARARRALLAFCTAFFGHTPT